MSPAVAPRADRRTTRLLRVDPGRAEIADGRIADLVAALGPGDLVVVNDAATLPASLPGETAAGAAVEVRLLGPAEGDVFPAVLFGAGDWRTRTEDRPAPPRVRPGDLLRIAGLDACVADVDASSPRLVSLVFSERGEALWRALYLGGRPVQYAHLERPLAMWDVQTAFAARPVAAEAPSAAFGLSVELLLALRRRGVALARLTHAAGLSSTGDPGLDARLPLAESYDVPARTAEAVARARRGGGRVLAVGTTVTRALEGAAANRGGRIGPGPGRTSLVLGPGFRRRVVDGILTGVHDPDTSHYRLLGSFAPRPLLDRAHALAASLGYRSHEFGDAILILESREA